jgi:hypothetical protein
LRLFKSGSWSGSVNASLIEAGSLTEWLQ